MDWQPIDSAPKDGTVIRVTSRPPGRRKEGTRAWWLVDQSRWQCHYANFKEPCPLLFEPAWWRPEGILAAHDGG